MWALLLGAALAAGAVHGAAAAAAEAHDYCIVGAGLAGVQLAHFMEDAGRSYVLLERGEAAGSFFRKFPRHRNLISINKRHTGRGGSELAREHNLRHDWHSLLSGLQSGDVDEELLFANLMNEDRFYPKADVLAAYADKLAQHWKLNIRTGAEVTAIRNAPAGGYELDVGGPGGNEAPLLACRWVVLAAGFTKPHVPDIPGLEQNSISYNEMPAEREFYENKTVAILGAGSECSSGRPGLCCHLTVTVAANRRWLRDVQGHHGGRGLRPHPRPLAHSHGLGDSLRRRPALRQRRARGQLPA